MIGEISRFFAEFVFLPLTTTNYVLSSRCYPGTIPPDIGKLVNLAELGMYVVEKLSGECQRLCDHMSRPVIGETRSFSCQLLVLFSFESG